MSKESEDYLDKIDCENTNYLLLGNSITLAEILDNYHEQQLKILNIPVVNGCATLEAIEQAADKLTDDERMDLIGRYCRHCGNLDNTCQCWNDE